MICNWRIIIKLCILLPIFGSFPFANGDSAKTVLTAAELGCFEPAERLGFRGVPNCKVAAKTPWAPEILYSNNADGFRGSLFSEPYDPSQLRVMFIGPGAEGIGLKDEEMLEQMVKQGLVQLGLKNVAVMNAATPGYFAPHYAMVASEYHRKYRPDILIYMHAPDQYAFDYLEKQNVEFGEFEDAIQYRGSEPITMSGQNSVRATLAELRGRSKVFWSLYRNTKSELELQRRFMEVSFKHLKEIGFRMGPQTKFVVVTTPRSTTNARSLSILNRPIGFLFNLVTPEIKIYIKQSEKEFRRRDIDTLILSNEFAKGETQELLAVDNPMAYTSKAIPMLASSISQKIFDIVNSLNLADIDTKRWIEIKKGIRK